jgi:parvulin-like peptidyl-prolyl isomerase
MLRFTASLTLVALCCVATSGLPSRAQDAATASGNKLAASVKAATVKADGVSNAEDISLADVERKLVETFGSLSRIRQEALPRFRALALSQLVDQSLVLQSLERDKLGASSQEVEQEFTQLKKTVAQTVPGTFADYLERTRHTEASCRRALAWELSWKRHAGRMITEEAKAAYFKEHRRDLDGTELRVAHILFKPADPAVAADLDELVKKAQQVREQIVAGKLSFEDAVVAHSGGTKKDGGDLGYILRQKSMPEPFARAAFELTKGQISRPVVTSFGVHLIRCGDERPGKLTLENADVQDAVKLRLRQQLFEEIAIRERKKVLADPKKPGIQFTGHSPYFKPGTDELIVPTAR